MTIVGLPNSEHQLSLSSLQDNLVVHTGKAYMHGPAKFSLLYYIVPAASNALSLSNCRHTARLHKSPLIHRPGFVAVPCNVTSLIKVPAFDAETIVASLGIVVVKPAVTMTACLHSYVPPPLGFRCSLWLIGLFHDISSTCLGSNRFPPPGPVPCPSCLTLQCSHTTP
jgi:hypothetical protein